MADPKTIVADLTEARETLLDLTDRWDRICDADPLDCDYDEYLARMEAAGFMEYAPVDDDALESAFAWERGIVPGGSMLQLTPLGLEVRRILSSDKVGDDD